MNQINVLTITKKNNIWAFDDPERGLIREPFVAGADVLCDLLANSVGSNDKFTAIFSKDDFPNQQIRLDWKRFECNGNVYHAPKFNHDLWLCPALLKYFDTAPKCIYLLVKA